MKVLCYGGGTNTTAMIVGLAARNIRPDLIIMADTWRGTSAYIRAY